MTSFSEAEPARRPTATSRRNTVALVAFTAITNLADGITKVALPLIATAISTSPVQVSGVAMTLTLPWLLVALHVGVLVDRVDRRLLLWLANTMRLTVIVLLLVASLTATISLPLLYASGLVLGIAEVIALTSAAALLPDAIAAPDRERANAWITGAETVCNEFCGPLVGGVLVAASTAFALSAVFAGYVLGVVALFFLVGKFRMERVPAASCDPVHLQISQGLKFLWNEQLLRLLSLVLTVLCACWGGWLALMPLFATTVMGLDAKGYGIMLSALGIGGLTGAISVTSLNHLFGRRAVMFADLVGTFAMVAAPIFTSSLWIIVITAFLGGLGGTLWAVNARTISQHLVSSAMMGRYSAAARLLSWGAMPIGAALIGLMAEIFGQHCAFIAFALSVVLLVTPFLRIVTPAAIKNALA